MLTDRQTIRQGLPRADNGEPWPPADIVPAAVGTPGLDPAPVPAAGGIEVRRRQGLPRAAGGDSWPPAATIAVPATAGQPNQAAHPTADVTPAGGRAADAGQVNRAAAGSLRQGLARTKGGEPWPGAGVVAAVKAIPVPQDNAAAPGTPPTAAGAPSGVQTAPTAQHPAPSAAQPAAATTASKPTSKPAITSPSQKDVKRFRPYTAAQWAGVSALCAVGISVVFGGLVFLVRILLGTDSMRDFVATYPGEYHLPEATPVGIPSWIGWQHFFNAFLMLMIIRTGIQIRREKRPAAYWTPKNKSGGKISFTVWLHQSLDLLWIANGIIFVILLLVTGHWARIIPTSWEVFPNALSAMLQYMSLDWPTENGWVNYNALQQLAYFTTVFIAAPLSAITGYRMSGLWPKKAKALTKSFPVEWARKLHFPVMVYFVSFILIHVTLVLATGALRNLNHMYAAQGSVDGVAYAGNWMGFWIFVVSLVVMAAGWIALRPLVVAPIARMFGAVSSR